MKLFTLFTILSLTANLLIAQPGSLDLSFNDSGKVLNYGFGIVNAITVQNDGKILIGGENTSDTLYGFTIARYLNDGILDASFGENGIIHTQFEGNSRIYSLHVLKNNKILASGYGLAYFKFPFYSSPMLAQYLPDGSPDPSFGNGGKVAINTGELFGAPVYARAMQVTEDGTIIQAGDNGGGETILIRYKPDGSLDENFGINGIAHIYLTGVDHINSLALQPDGKMIVGGEYFYQTSDGNFLIARIKEDGTLDSSFGHNGKRNINFFGNEDGINALALQPDGKILAAGRTDTNGISTPVMTLVRFKPDGFFDSSFGNNGKAYAGFENMQSSGNSMVLQEDGKINVGGFARTLPDADTGKLLFGLAQFNPDGSHNNAFGKNGVVTTDFGYFQQIKSISLQPNGKIVAAGLSIIPDGNNLPYNNLALARYNNGGTPVVKKIKKLLRWIYNHKNGVTLNWPGAGSSYYMVQRSGYGTTAAWGNLARVEAGSRQVSNVQTYSYTDDDPLPGTNYYRVQQVSATGAVEISNVVAVSVNAGNNILVSPNPVQNVLHIKGLEATATYSLQITNTQGNTKIKATVKQAAAYNLNIQRLNRGVYYLNVTSNNKTTAVKFVKE